METETSFKTQMMEEISEGLQSDTPYIPSKYFYDNHGSRLFEEIMRMPSYYLTDAEKHILETHHQNIIRYFAHDSDNINLIELGAGDGIKTQILTESLMKNNIRFTYVPVDISNEALKNLETNFNRKYPQIKIQPLHTDYETGLSSLNQQNGAKNVVLFLGSTLGNFTPQASYDFLAMISRNLKANDLLLIGLDLVKDPNIILEAYNDPDGITAEFNYNLLRRLNRELEANFELSKWRHQPVYDPAQKAAKSYLIATEKQTITFAGNEKTFHFDPWDFIHTEISQKYDRKMISALSKNHDFKIIKEYTDNRNYFLNAIWQKSYSI